jgi:hypothetical protein
LLALLVPLNWLILVNVFDISERFAQNNFIDFIFYILYGRRSVQRSRIYEFWDPFGPGIRIIDGGPFGPSLRANFIDFIFYIDVEVFNDHEFMNFGTPSVLAYASLMVVPSGLAYARIL